MEGTSSALVWLETAEARAGAPREIQQNVNYGARVWPL